ncbi:zinc finger protein 414 isoform 1-T1 [Spinachia spinachia]
MQTSPAANGGNNRAPCPLYGCKRVYSDTTALESHVRDHEIPAQSLPGKVLLCSTLGCSGSFPDMQKLMEHMRHHHKPNIFFLCESCRTKLRSYRGLLTHLHTCSKVSRGRPKLADPAAAIATDLDEKPPLLDRLSTPELLPSEFPTMEGSYLAAVLDAEPPAPLHGTSFLSDLQASSPLLAPPQPWVKSEPSDFPLPSNSDGLDRSSGCPGLPPDTNRVP